MDTLSIAVRAAALADEHNLLIRPESLWNALDVKWERYNLDGKVTSYVEVARRPVVGIL